MFENLSYKSEIFIDYQLNLKNIANEKAPKKSLC